MTAGVIAKSDGFCAAVCPQPDLNISGVYICDLLSRVIGRAPSGCAWITVARGMNTVAAASLANVSCVVFAEGVMPDEESRSRALSCGINLICTDMSAYDAAAAIMRFTTENAR